MTRKISCHCLALRAARSYSPILPLAMSCRNRHRVRKQRRIFCLYAAHACLALRQRCQGEVSLRPWRVLVLRCPACSTYSPMVLSGNLRRFGCPFDSLTHPGCIPTIDPAMTFTNSTARHAPTGRMTPLWAREGASHAVHRLRHRRFFRRDV